MSATNTKTTTQATRRPRALLLDDDAVVVNLLRASLQCRGFEVRSESDGAAGVAALLDELLELDVLVVDLDLPGRDGWALLRLIRCAGGERELPVVVLANDPTPAVRAQLRALGADAVVDRRDGPGAVARAVEDAFRLPDALVRLCAAGQAWAERFLPVPLPA